MMDDRSYTAIPSVVRTASFSRSPNTSIDSIRPEESGASTGIIGNDKSTLIDDILIMYTVPATKATILVPAARYNETRENDPERFRDELVKPLPAFNAKIIPSLHPAKVDVWFAR